MSNKALYFADTPTQVLNVTNLAIQLEEKPDLIIYDQFINAKEYADLLRDTDIFNIVYLLPYIRESKKWQRRREVYTVWFSPKPIGIALDFTQYSTFTIAFPSPITNNICARLNADIKMRYYEDGTGTYCGNVFRSISYAGKNPSTTTPVKLRTRLQKSFLQKLKKGFNPAPTVIYVYNPQILTFTSKCPVKKINFHEKTSQIFCTKQISDYADYCSSIYKRIIIFFDLPRVTPNEINRFSEIQELDKKAKKAGLQLFIKPHPLTPNPEVLYKNLNMFPPINWEIFVSIFDISNWILLGEWSSAMLTPCVMFNKTPQLLFLIGNGLDEDKTNLVLREEIIKATKKAYDQKANLVGTIKDISDAVKYI